MDMDGYLERASRRADRFISKYGGNSWRGFFHFLFWNVGQIFYVRRPMRPINDDVCRILFLLHGGMGDEILTLNYIQNLARFLDLRHEIAVGALHPRDIGMIRTLCQGQDFIHHVVEAGQSIRSFDLVFEMIRFPRLLYYHRAKIARLSVKLTKFADGMETFTAKNPFLFLYSTPADAFGIDYARFMGHDRLRQGDVDDLLGVESLFCPKIVLETENVLAKFSLQNRPFITVARGSGGKNRNVSMKLGSAEKYGGVLQKINARFPNLAVVQVGMASNPLLAGVTHDLRGKTNLDEIMVLLRQSACHLDGEGGLVHLRHFLGGGPSVVLFGPTSAEFYGYPENANLSSGFCPKGCEWMTTDYETQCPRGFSRCENSARIDSETVFKRIMEILDERL